MAVKRACEMGMSIGVCLRYDEIGLRSIGRHWITPHTAKDVRGTMSNIMPGVNDKLCRLHPETLGVLCNNVSKEITSVIINKKTGS